MVGRVVQFWQRVAQDGEVVAQNGGEMRKDGVEVVEGRCEGGEVLIW